MTLEEYDKKQDDKATEPNPGSDEAIRQGCICPVLDNRHGKGAFDFGDGNFWITEGCPLQNKIKKGE